MVSTGVRLGLRACLLRRWSYEDATFIVAHGHAASQWHSAVEGIVLYIINSSRLQRCVALRDYNWIATYYCDPVPAAPAQVELQLAAMCGPVWPSPLARAHSCGPPVIRDCVNRDHLALLRQWQQALNSTTG